MHGRITLLVTLALVLAGCAGDRYARHRDSAPPVHVSVDHIPDAVPRVEPRSKYGNPESYVVKGRRYRVRKSAAGYVARGIASWYGTKFHGYRTASGETYDMYAMTAAHRTLPLPTYVEVTNLDNGRRVVVRVNDRGPFHDNRIIDLSYAAARKLGMIETGTAPVEVRAIDPKAPRRTASARPGYTLYLQAGAFASRTNAERLRRRLLAVVRGHPVDTARSHRDGLYRVRIGPLSSVELADRLAQRLSSLGITEPHVVVY